jgi:hypothetical protein
MREFQEISPHVVMKGNEEIFPNRGRVQGGIPHRKIPHCYIEKGGKKKRKNKKRKKGKEEMSGPTHYPA